MRKKIMGITLLEALLVLAIMSSLFLIALNFYRQYRDEKDFNEIKYNVEILFQSLRQYYLANCQSPNGSLNPNALDNPVDPGAPFPIDIKTQLVKFFPTRWPIYSEYVDTNYGSDGYAAQFNPGRNLKKNAYTCWYFGTGNDPSQLFCTDLKEVAHSQVVLWQSQVVVKITNPNKAHQYKDYAGADCLVDEASPGSVIDCGLTPSEEASYLVWQRLPSFAASNLSTDLWLSLPVAKQFTEQYTNDPMYDLYNTKATGISYYLCGG